MADRDTKPPGDSAPPDLGPARAFVPVYSGADDLDPAHVSTKRGFVFQYPPFSTLDARSDDILREPRDAGLYVHVPFCGYHCAYCYYAISLDRRPESTAAYVAAVTREAQLAAEHPRLATHRITTIFFGGGTPTVLAADQLTGLATMLRSSFDCSGVEEFTVEADPTSVTRELMEALRAAGVNRVSVGVQSFSTDINRLNERQHSEEQSLSAIDEVRAAGIHNLNIDLICGLIGDTAAAWARTVDRLLEIAPEHATIYLFSLRPQTRSYHDLELGSLPLPPDEQERVEWLLEVRRRLLDAGYVQTTPNCFARAPRFEQIHQRNAWSSQPLIGVGNSAYSFVDDCVTQNVRPVPTYIERTAAGKCLLERAARLNPLEQMIRYCVLRLKLLSIDLADFERRFGLDLEAVCGPQLRRLEDSGFIRIDGKRVLLTTSGIVYVDDVCRSLYSVQVRERLNNLEPGAATPLVRSLA